MQVLASLTDVRHAGNFSQKVDDDVLTFYLELTSFFFKEMVGETTYNKAYAKSLPGDDNDKLRKAEALLTVGFALPSVGTSIAESGVLRTVAVGSRGGDLELASFVKEIQALAANFVNMANMILPSKYRTSESYNKVWHNVVQRVFPGLDELLTTGTVKSYAESVIQEERGDETYEPGK